MPMIPEDIMTGLQSLAAAGGHDAEQEDHRLPCDQQQQDDGEQQDDGDRGAVGEEHRLGVRRAAPRERLNLELEYRRPVVVEEDVRQALAPVLAEQRVGKEAEKVEDELGQVVAARAALPLGVQQLDDGQRVEDVDVVVGDWG